MKPEFVNGNILAFCPTCGVPSTFLYQDPADHKQYGVIVINDMHTFEGTQYPRVLHVLFKCVSCATPGVGTLHNGNQYLLSSKLDSFWPGYQERAKLPDGIPA